MIVRVPDIIRPVFGNVIWRKIEPSSKKVYLTFDDGPVPGVTEKVLDILKSYDCKATFFCVADNVRKYPHVYERLIAEGHCTGNHTFNHLKGYNYSTNDYVKNVNKAAQYIRSDLFRPPYGRITFTQLKELRKHYRIVFWDVLTCDYDRNLSPEVIFNNVKKYVRNGSLIVFHDSIKAEKNVLNALPPTIEYLKSKGYDFGLL